MKYLKDYCLILPLCFIVLVLGVFLANKSGESKITVLNSDNNEIVGTISPGDHT